MDHPERRKPLRQRWRCREVMLGRHEEELSAARLAVEGLTAQVTDLSSRLLMLYQDPISRSPRYPLHEPRINNPPCYAGEPTECRAFLTQCEVVFLSSPRRMRETPLGSPLYSHFSRGERVNGAPLLGRHGLLAVAVTSSSRRR